MDSPKLNILRAANNRKRSLQFNFRNRMVEHEQRPKPFDRCVVALKDDATVPDGDTKLHRYGIATWMR